MLIVAVLIVAVAALITGVLTDQVTLTWTALGLTAVGAIALVWPMIRGKLPRIRGRAGLPWRRQARVTPELRPAAVERSDAARPAADPDEPGDFVAEPPMTPATASDEPDERAEPPAPSAQSSADLPDAGHRNRGPVQPPTGDRHAEQPCEAAALRDDDTNGGPPDTSEPCTNGQATEHHGSTPGGVVQPSVGPGLEPTRATEVLVHVVPGRRRYHTAGCELIAERPTDAVVLEEALEEGLSACTRCSASVSVGPAR